MHRTRGRVLTLLAVAAAAAAAYLAVHSGLNAGAAGRGAAPAVTARPHKTTFGPSSVLVTGHPSGVLCYRVIEPGGSAHACRPAVKPTEIGYTVSPHAIGGVAGSKVTAVIVKLTRRGTKWATLRDGVFYADVPIPYRVRAVIKVLRGGTRERFVVTTTR
jgi:hypothetical protein